jgi:AbrB family looped-hinge helix DNA binding protein
VTTHLSTKGQLIIPKKIRDRHGWQAGSEVIIEDRGNCVVVRSAEAIQESSLDQLIGCTGYAGPRRSLADLEAAIARGAREHR